MLVEESSKRAGKPAARIALVLLLVTATLVIALVESGCSNSSSTYGSAPAGSGPASATVKTAASEVQTCGACGGRQAPGTVVGAATMDAGVQVVSVRIENGFYVPNSFTVKSGAPVRAVFTGNATKCVAKPKFASLGKSGDVTATGTSAVELGALSPGQYVFTCAMGSNPGTITVE